MKSLKKLSIFLILIFLAGLGIFTIYFSLSKNFGQPRSQPSPILEKFSEKFASQYFIENMRKREYDGGEVKIERNLGNFGKFTSYIVSYPLDGIKIFALMNVPASIKPDNGFPVVIVNHGYINPETYSTTSSYKTISDFYANQGFLVLKPDYRGHGNSQGSGGGGLSRIEYAVDVLNLIASIPTISQADPEKIFMYGHSMGAEVALRVLEITDKIKAATLWAPATTQFPESLLYFVRRHRPQSLPEIEAAINAYFSQADFPKLSTIENTNLIKTPLTIHHGTADSSVPFQWSVELGKKLTETNTTHTFYTYQGEDHNFTRGSWGTAANRDLELFKKILE